VTGKISKTVTFFGFGKPLLALLCAFSLSACVYRVDILQGNNLDSEAIDQVEVGMTRNQVRFILGTPMIKDPFHAQRWDYVYYFKKGGSRKAERERLVVYFEDDKVASVDKNAPIG
jgi:outer membrane protein assembly factor BamE